MFLGCLKWRPNLSPSRIVGSGFPLRIQLPAKNRERSSKVRLTVCRLHPLLFGRQVRSDRVVYDDLHVVEWWRDVGMPTGIYDNSTATKPDAYCSEQESPQDDGDAPQDVPAELSRSD